MTEFKDQMNQTIRLSVTPRRIVSLVPSQTELLFDLGVGEKVVGITKFCIHPEEWYKTKTRVGGTKDAKEKIIALLEPDLIIGNKEENEQANIESLKKFAPIWMSDIYSLEDALKMISQVGAIVSCEHKAKVISDIIIAGFDRLSFYTEGHEKKRSVLYLIWRNPYLCAGSNTFIDDMLSRCGLTNVCKGQRYPELQNNLAVDPDLIFLSSEPYPFKEKHIEELQMIYPKSNVILVDGEMFSWYGSRLQYVPDYFLDLLQSIEG